MESSTWARIAMGIGLAAAPLFAHHSFEAQYDREHPVTVTGTVKQIVWKGPHVRLLMDVMGDGAAGNWEMELDSPNALLKQGWRVDSLRVGDRVTVSAYPAKDGSRQARASRVIPATR